MSKRRTKRRKHLRYVTNVLVKKAIIQQTRKWYSRNQDECKRNRGKRNQVNQTEKLKNRERNRKRYHTSDTLAKDIKRSKVLARYHQHKPDIRKKQNTHQRRRYHSCQQQKRKKQSQSRIQRQSEKTSLDFTTVKKKFDMAIRESPDYVCSSCHRIRFKSQVKQYNNKSYKSSSLLCRVITDKHVHVCNSNCSKTCKISSGPRGKQYICFTCDGHLKRNSLPPECYVNGLQLADMPKDLAKLNTLERHLISLRIPFMKLFRMPKSSMDKVIGPVTRIPSDIQKSVNILPRSLHDADIVTVSLKRKLEYNKHYMKQLVNLTLINKCLKFLIEEHPMYTDVSITVEGELEESQLRDPNENDSVN